MRAIAVVGLMLAGAATLAGCKCRQVVQHNGGLGTQALRPGVIEYYRGSTLIGAQTVPVADTYWADGFLIVSQGKLPLRKSDGAKNVGPAVSRDELAKMYADKLSWPVVYDMRTELANPADPPLQPAAPHRYGP